jgi:DNA primase
LRPLNSAIKKGLQEAAVAFTEALPGSPGEAYLQERGIGPKTAERMRLGYVDPATAPDGWDRHEGRISIPYLNAKGEVVWIKFRATPETKPDYKGEIPKYSQEAGGGTPLFNTIALSAPGELIVLCEGEFDVITLTALGIPAVGIPGANNWKDHFYRCLQGWDRVVIFFDEDKPGRELVKVIKKRMPDIIPLAAPGGHHDINEAYLAGLGGTIIALARGEVEPDGQRVEEGSSTDREVPAGAGDPPF